jgi:1,4-dihydroxy-2-naphthoate octaprenyltransferase
MAARPRTLWAAVAPVAVGSAMAVDDGAAHLPSAVTALVGAVLIQIGANIANDYFDFTKGADNDERLGPLRVTQAGLVQPRTMRIAIGLVFSLAVMTGAYLVWRAGWPVVIVGLLSVIFALLYTGGPYPLGYHGWGDLLVLVFFGPVAVGGTYYVQTLTINTPVLLAGLSPGLFSVAILTVNNLRDIDNDRRTGKNTLPVRFGRSFARAEYIAVITLGSALPALLHAAYGSHPFAALTLATPLFAVPIVRTVLTSRDGPTLNVALARTGKLLLLFAVLFSVGWLL